MTRFREWTLQAAGEAASIFDRFPLENRTSFDIIRAVTDLGFPVMFRPMKGLLGATVTVEEGAQGILVSTKRGLPIQRFTLAHELGHLVLGHELRFDFLTEDADEMSPDASKTPEEKAAEAFASELLAPRKLITRIALSRAWRKADLQRPAIVYQLALRLGVSFKATCWALARGGFIPDKSAKHLVEETKVNEVKASLIAPYKLSDPWADVWAVAQEDAGSMLECGPDDIFVVAVKDEPSAGFLWELEESVQGFEVVFEKTDISESYGGESSRVLVMKSRAPGHHRLTLRHKRPWSGEVLSTVDYSIANFGKEMDGFPRFVKLEMLGAG
jgi:Zn-dependent peptidase ImmA (M78 family)/predicted secreted protein